MYLKRSIESAGVKAMNSINYGLHLSAVIWIFLLFIKVSAGAARSLNAEVRLLNELSSHYDPDSRPVYNANDTVLVHFTLKFLQIMDLVEKNQTLITQVTVHEEWWDELLRWDPRDYDGIQYIALPPRRLWLPDTYIFNNAEKGYEGFMFVNESKALVRHDGHVFWSLPLIVKSSCAVDVKYFPFDNQRCYVIFGSWTYEKSQLNIVLGKNAYDMESYIQNNEFDILHTSLTLKTLSEEEFSSQYFQLSPEGNDPGRYPQVVMSLHIRRKPLYYFYTVVAPVLVLCIMMTFTFLLPCDSGDKVGIGLTVFLSLYVLQLAIAENIPSNSLPLISLFMTLVMTLNSISLMCATLVLNLKKRGDTKPCPEVPERILNIFTKILAKSTFTRKLVFRDLYSTCREEERYLRKLSIRSPSMDFSALYNAQHSGLSIKDVLGAAGTVPPESQKEYVRLRRGGTSEGTSSAPNLISAGNNTTNNAQTKPSKLLPRASSSSNTKATESLFANTLRLPVPFFTRRPSNDQSPSSRKLMATRNRKLEWYFIAEVVDKVLFILFFIALLVTVITSLVIVPELHKYD